MPNDAHNKIIAESAHEITELPISILIILPFLTLRGVCIR